MKHEYARRLVDDQLDEFLPEIAAIAIEGAKGVGKSVTASRRARTVINLDADSDRESIQSYPQRLEHDATPILLDEWQRFPQTWDLVRRSVDRDSSGGRFLLTGSATPVSGPIHSGAGRIVRIRMRPMSLVERQLGPTSTVSLGAMLRGDQEEVAGRSTIGIERYTEEILASGLPGIRHLSERARNLQLDGYLDRIIDVEFADQGHAIRRPATLRAWLTAYAAATATNASYSKVLDGATPGEDNKPAKLTTLAYRDVLTRLWMLDPVPGWVPTLNIASRLAQAPKHHLADPAFAARLLGATQRGLLTNSVAGVPKVRDGLLLGGLFESLVTQSVQTYAQQNSARVHHLRTGRGDHEIDLIVEGDDRRVVALEVKLAPSVTDEDVRHLIWLKQTAPDLVADMVVITTGEFAYRRPDGVAVVPAALLGP